MTSKNTAIRKRQEDPKSSDNPENDNSQDIEIHPAQQLNIPETNS